MTKLLLITRNRIPLLSLRLGSLRLGCSVRVLRSNILLVFLRLGGLRRLWILRCGRGFGPLESGFTVGNDDALTSIYVLEVHVRIEVLQSANIPSPKNTTNPEGLDLCFLALFRDFSQAESAGANRRNRGDRRNWRGNRRKIWRKLKAKRRENSKVWIRKQTHLKYPLYKIDNKWHKVTHCLTTKKE